MDNKKEYWPVVGFNAPQYHLEARSNIALVLLEHFGSIAAKIEGEDSAGRSKIELQSPTELVQRCFAIADAYVDECEQRNSIRSFTEDEILEAEERIQNKKTEISNRKFAERASRKLNQG